MIATILFGLFCTATVLFLLVAWLSNPTPIGMPEWSLWGAAIAAGCAVSVAPAVFGWGPS